MLKKLLPFSLALPLLVAGCTDPIVPYKDQVQYPQVHVESYALQNSIRIEPPIAKRVGAGQLKVQIPIRNLTDSDISLDYIYYFYNGSAQSESPSSRMHLDVPRKGINQVEFVSLTPADDFRVEIFWAK